MEMYRISAVLCALVAVRGGGSQAPPPLEATRFDVDCEVTLNDVERHDRDVGYRLRAALDVAPAGEDLLRFDLVEPALYVRGAALRAEPRRRSSVWDDAPHSTFYGRWSGGLLDAALLDPRDALDVLNFKRALLGLFQFQTSSGERNETDATGECRVLYETPDENTVRKFKRACRWEGGGDGDGGEESEAAVRRVTRYRLEGGALRSVHAEEVWRLGVAGGGLKARSYISLRARTEGPAGEGPAPPPALEPLPLQLAAGPQGEGEGQGQGEGEEEEEERESVEAALRATRTALSDADDAGGGGTGHVAAAMLRLVGAVRRATAPQLLAALHDTDHADLRTSLVWALGAAGGARHHSAAAAFLQLEAGDVSPHLAHRYLLGVAAAPAPEESVALEVLRLGERRDDRLGEGALLAAGAAGGRLSGGGAARVRDALLRAAGRRGAGAGALRAVGNMRRADTCDPLLRAAETGRRGEAVAALAALRAAPSAALRHMPHLERLARIATDARRSLEVRAAALDLVLQRGATVPRLVPTLCEHVTRHGGPELRRLFWSRARPLAARHPRMRDALLAVSGDLRTWDALAPNGTSAVVSRSVGALSAWGARLDAHLAAAGGVLRAATVRLVAGTGTGTDTGADHALLEVEVAARGLEELAGGGAGHTAPEDEDEDEGGETAASLRVAVGGAATPELRLFDGRAELLARVWAGVGSEPAAVARAVRLPVDARATLPLLAGVALRVRVGAALAYAIDADAQASLWSRTGRAALALRAGGAATVRARLDTAWGSVAGRALLAASPRLLLAADLDFYDEVELCVRADLPGYEYSRDVSLRSSLGRAGRALTVRRSRVSRAGVAGRTLALTRDVARACRRLRPQD